VSDDDLEECWSLVRPTPVPRPPVANPEVCVGKAMYRKESSDHDDNADIFDDLDNDDDGGSSIFGDMDQDSIFGDDFDPRAAGPLIDDQGNVVDPESLEMVPLTDHRRVHARVCKGPSPRQGLRAGRTASPCRVGRRG